MAGVDGDVWRQPVDRSGEPTREPGPIDINRYVVPSGAYAGIPTFMGFPVAMNPEDLRAGGVDVAVIGAWRDDDDGLDHRSPHQQVAHTATPQRGSWRQLDARGGGLTVSLCVRQAVPGYRGT